MIVVADTSPLNYLIRIGAVHVLKPLYTHVLIPQTVADELKKEKHRPPSKHGSHSLQNGSKSVRTLFLIPHCTASTPAKPQLCHWQSRFEPTKY